jgi:hypothetical protein
MKNNPLAKWHVLCLTYTKRTYMKKLLFICQVLIVMVSTAAHAQSGSPDNIVYGSGNPVSAVTTHIASNGNTVVKWAVENAGLINYLVVERSVDGVHYTAVSKKLAPNNHINAIEDSTVGAGVYRVAFIKKDGTTFYGQVNKHAFTAPMP